MYETHDANATFHSSDAVENGTREAITLNAAMYPSTPETYTQQVVYDATDAVTIAHRPVDKIAIGLRIALLILLIALAAGFVVFFAIPQLDVWMNPPPPPALQPPLRL